MKSLLLSLLGPIRTKINDYFLAANYTFGPLLLINNNNNNNNNNTNNNNN